jgi:LDH2 family malate/lactate/ureidoglycolate dehydrogenase
MRIVGAEPLEAFAAAVLEAGGLIPEDARLTARSLVQANLRGVDSHGVLRLIQYVRTLQAGAVKARPTVRVLQADTVTALVDADGGYGYRPARLAMDLAVERARLHGVGVVGVRNSHHFGMAALYVIPPAEQGFIAVMVTNASPLLAPAGGREARVGNNPWAFGIPRRPPAPPLVLDMALSQVALGKIRLAAAEGRPIPPGWALDREGRPTTDAAEALRAGLLAPAGGYKGFGLALVAEVLAGVLTGSPFGLAADAHGRPAGGVGHLALALDPGRFGPREAFLDGVERLAADVLATPLAPEADRIELPGDPEYRREEERRTHGIPISDELAGQLVALARELGVTPPAELG